MEERETVVSGFEGDVVRKIRVSWTEQVTDPVEVQSAELIQVMLVLFALCMNFYTSTALCMCIFSTLALLTMFSLTKKSAE